MNAAIIIFDDFTDIDLFLIWDILGRQSLGWEVKILGQKNEHVSTNGLSIKTHGNIAESINFDVVIFCSGKKGTRKVINDQSFLNSIRLDINKQLIGSICSGALIMAKLGLLDGLTATTHPQAKKELQSLGIEAVDKPLVAHKNIATTGGCLAGVYLAAWLIQNKHGTAKRDEVIEELLPVGQQAIYQELIAKSI
nr:Putative amidotransferase [uncultured bacterium]